MGKLSDELTQFGSDVAKLAAGDRAKIYAAIRAAIGPVKSVRRPSTKISYESRDVDLEAIAGALPPDLKLDWRAITRSVGDSTKRHGEQWLNESLAPLIAKYVLPEPTEGEKIAATPGFVEALKKAGFVRNVPSSSTT